MERRLIDANAIHGECNSDNPEFIAGWNALAVEIDQAPTISAVEVVRCAQCVDYRLDPVKHCALSGMQKEEDDYCSYGERREPDDSKADRRK